MISVSMEILETNQELILQLDQSCMCCNQLSEPFTVERGVKQGSVLSFTLFLTVMDHLLKLLKEKKLGLSLCQTYARAAIHADDPRKIATSKDGVSQQASVISNFVKNANVKMNASKLEVLKILQQHTILRN